MRHVVVDMRHAECRVSHAQSYSWLSGVLVRVRARPLKAKEVERIMGFPKQHTKHHQYVENSAATRRRMLGNSFAVANIAYLLSPLKVRLLTPSWFGGPR